MIIDTIPFEVFLNHVFPYLMLMDIQKLAIVSKEMKALCENNEIWKEIYIRKRKRDFYEKELIFQVSCIYGPGRYDENYEQKY